MKINVEEVVKLKERLLEINKYKLEDIEWYRNGKKLEIPKKKIEDFLYTGLNNTDFVTGEFYDENEQP